MSTNNKVARIVGALFLLSNVAFLLGAVGFIAPALNAPDYLNQIAIHRNLIALGVLLEIVNGIAYVCVALLMYRIFKPRFESLALGYVGFRLLEFVMQVLSDLSPLSLLTLSEDLMNVGPTGLSAFQATGAMLLAERLWAFQMISITFGIGALLFYYMLYQSMLVPRFISVWGMVGATFVLLSVISDMFALNIPDLGLVMLLNELFLAVWLIVKGFSTTVITPVHEVDTKVVSAGVSV